MNKIVLTVEDLKKVFDWKDSHLDEVSAVPAPLKALEIILPETHIVVKGIRENCNRLKLHISCKGFQPENFIMVRKGEKFKKLLPCWWELSSGESKQYSREDIESVFTLYSTVMALMVCGNVDVPQDEQEASEQRTEQHSGAKHKATPPKPTVTYILRSGRHGISIGSPGHHASPAGTFGVRGHYRHYQSGKVVWIDEYKKGTGKKKDTNYRIGKVEE